jgi:glycosyl-4,4'-diaponeurosporenoate acyltransferase
MWSPSDPVAVLLDALVWAVWGLAVGYAFHRFPATWFDDEHAVTRIRGWERGGRFWSQRFGIKRWKDRLPEAGSAFAGGFSKRHLVARDAGHLRRFVVETRRAEWVHLTVLAVVPLFWLWNPPSLALVMLVYGVAANVPCILVQRYNRARLLRVLSSDPRTRR